MVVSADSQKIFRKNSRNKHQRVSSYAYSTRRIRLSRKPIPLFLHPFICALFIFSIYINISDFFWQVKSPEYPISNLTLPDEKQSSPLLKETMKASLDLTTFINLNPNREEKVDHLSLSLYTVRQDDRYSIIAEKFHITLDSLLSVNGIEKNGIPEEGSELKIPNMSGIFYVVQKGDTLTSISSLYGIDVENIRKINQLYSSVIHIGDKLFLPGITMNNEELKRIVGNKFLIPSSGTVKNNYGSYLDSTTGLKNYNYGIDIINRKGTAVYAAKDGIIKSTTYNPYFGRVVLMNHNSSFQSMYGCLDSIVVKPGDVVQRGDLLGYIGNSGFRSGEHLQFSIFKDKEDVDTLEYIF